MFTIGSRYETKETAGCAYMWDKLTFKSTRDFASDQLTHELELLGGQFASNTTRDLISYQASVFSKGVEKLMHVLSQIVLYPKYDVDELNEAKENTLWELEDLQWNNELSLPEKLHQVAYRSSLNPFSGDLNDVNTLGRTMRIHPQQMDSINVNNLRQFRDTWFTPDRMVVAAVGINHDDFVLLAEKYFGDVKESSPSIKKAQQDAIMKCKYTGGTFIKDTTNLPKSPNPDDMVLTHVQIAYESLAVTDPDIYSLATLASLLGGGGSFSAGGPGLFGITASVLTDKQTHHYVVPVIADQLAICTQNCTPDELNRAKNQLKSNLLMNLESKAIQLEDIGRQTLSQDFRMDVGEMCRRIDLVECADIVRVGRRVILGENIPSRFEFNDNVCKNWNPTGPTVPSIVVEGDLTGSNDSLWKVEETLQKWGLMTKTKQSAGRKGFFSRL
ncbi:Mitochondrial-processing peptidase subunit alpha [Globomyces sp. JEL0801]|nr:Mitochondrial-processing peptidase subunit alpha [Globomyces sp. JEL0801]